MSQNKKLVLYHNNCLDGFVSAWVVGNSLGFGAVEMKPVEYEQPIPDITGRDVYIVDFSYNPEVLLPVLPTANSVIVLDHHATAIKKWPENWKETHAALNQDESFDKLLLIFDISKSGVGVVWDFFHNSGDRAYCEMPRLLQLVQDYDLYQHEYEASRLVHAALTNGIMQDKEFDKISEMIPIIPQSVYETGMILLNAQRILAQNILARTAGMAIIGEHKVPVAPVPYELRDIAGEILYEGFPFSATFEDRLEEHVRKWSLRSHPETGINVLEIAEAFGGGGHEHSAGFVQNLPI